MYRLFWIDRERENTVKLFEDESLITTFNSIEEASRILSTYSKEYPKVEYVILPYFKIH